MAIFIPQEDPQTVSPPRIQEAANETTFGGGPGVEAQNAQVQQIAQHTNEIATFEKIRADQTAVQGATAQLSTVFNKLVSDPEEGLPAYKGVNAMQGHDKVMAEFQKQANELANGLQPDQQGAFNKIAIEHGDALNQHAMAYVNNQIEQHDTNTFNASVTGMTQAAANNMGSPESIAKFKGTIDDIVGARAKRLGLEQPETDALKSKVSTNFYESIISQAVNDPKTLPLAKQLFAQHEPEMDLESRDRVRNLLDVVPKQQAAEAKAQQADFYKANMKTAMLDMFDGKMTLSEAQRRFRDGQLDKSDYDLLETKLSKPDAAVIRTFEQSNPQTFNAIRQAQLTGSKDPGEIQRMIAQGAASKDITPDDGKYLMGLNSEKPPTPRDKYIQAQSDTIKDFGDRYFAEKNFFGMPTNKDKTSQESQELVNNFYTAVDKAKAQGEDIDDIRDQVMKNAAAKRYPGIGKLDKMPDVVIDIKGNVTRLLNPEQHSGLKPKYTITPTSESDKAKKEDQ